MLEKIQQQQWVIYSVQLAVQQRTIWRPAATEAPGIQHQQRIGIHSGRRCSSQIAQACSRQSRALAAVALPAKARF